MDVIEFVNFSDWAASIVIVKKSKGNVRSCADYSTRLNEALQSHHYPLSLPEDLFAKVNGGKHSAESDLSDAYLQIAVADESKYLIRSNTHTGLSWNNKMPFGVKMEPSIFQQIMDTMLQGIIGVAAYLYDIAIMGADKMNLQKKCKRVLTHTVEYGLHLRTEKCTIPRFHDR